MKIEHKNPVRLGNNGRISMYVTVVELSKLMKVCVCVWSRTNLHSLVTEDKVLSIGERLLAFCLLPHLSN